MSKQGQALDNQASGATGAPPVGRLKPRCSAAAAAGGHFGSRTRHRPLIGAKQGDTTAPDILIINNYRKEVVFMSERFFG